MKAIKLFRKTQRFFSTQVQPWIETESRIAKLRGDLVLSDQSQIKKYAINLVKGYYRATNKDAITENSVLSDHGLDSLDSIELCVQLEDELGYIIEAETMPKISKVKHIIHFIKHIEAYKNEHKILPQEKSQQYEEDWNNWMPFGENIRSKLLGHTKKVENH